MSTIIGGIEMALPIMVGAGVCKTPESVFPYMREDVSVGAVVTGSYTPEPRKGNEGTLFWPAEAKEQDFQFALNAYGMPNCGFGEAQKAFREKSPKHRHPLVVSIAGFSVDDYALGIQVFGNNAEFCPAAIELNLGCPNTMDKKPLPMSYDIGDMRAILQMVASKWSNCPIWVKLSPYLTPFWHNDDKRNLSKYVDTTHVPIVPTGFGSDIARLIGEFSSSVKAVVMTNTIPAAIFQVDGKAVTTPSDGKAGLSGPVLRQFAMRQLRVFVDTLPPSVDIIYVGGITHGDHVVEALEKGAKAVQCTTFPFMFGGPKSFVDLIAGSEKLQEYLSSTVSTQE